MNRLISKTSFEGNNFKINVSEFNSNQSIFYILFDDQKQVLNRRIIEVER
jgi:hypothetical protein